MKRASYLKPMVFFPNCYDVASLHLESLINCRLNMCLKSSRSLLRVYLIKAWQSTMHPSIIDSLLLQYKMGFKHILRLAITSEEKFRFEREQHMD